jgi:hypothetical protein
MFWGFNVSFGLMLGEFPFDCRLLPVGRGVNGKVPQQQLEGPHSFDQGG